MEEQRAQATKKMFEAFSQFKKVQKYIFTSKGIKRSEFHVLMIIYKLTQDKQQGVKVLDISRKLEIAPPSITLLVNSLVKDGYVQRKTNEEDRRSVQINLTEKGLSVLKKSWETINSCLERIVDNLGIEKSNQFSDLLSGICQYFKEYNSSETGCDEKE